MCDKWTNTWPTEPGLYWFYGYRYGYESCGEKEEPTFILCHAVESPHASGLTLIGDGAFMYESETDEAQFLKTEYPSIPHYGYIK